MCQRLLFSSLTSLWSTLADDPELAGMSPVISPVAVDGNNDTS